MGECLALDTVPKASVKENIPMANTLVKFVESFVAKNGRGCPKGALQFVGGFSDKEIKAAAMGGEIVSVRGPQGGYYVAGYVPVAGADKAPTTLKARMADFLRTLDSDIAKALVSDYERECAKRASVAKNRKK
jgi:hypothetical protein